MGLTTSAGDRSRVGTDTAAAPPPGRHAQPAGALRAISSIWTGYGGHSAARARRAGARLCGNGSHRSPRARGLSLPHVTYLLGGCAIHGR